MCKAHPKQGIEDGSSDQLAEIQLSNWGA
jgi:hypothetical protein